MKRMLAGLLCFAFALLCAAGLAAVPAARQVTVTDVGLSRIGQGKTSFLYMYAPALAHVGEVQRMTVAFALGKDVPLGETFTFSLSGDLIDLENCTLYVVAERGGLESKRATGLYKDGVLYLTLRADDNFLPPGGTLMLYLAGKRLAEHGTLRAGVSRVTQKEFAAEVPVALENYTLTKKTLPINVLALREMDTLRAAYAISRNGTELFWLLVDKNHSIGFAVEVRGVLHAVEYDISARRYYDLLTNQTVLSRDAMHALMRELKFSFLSPPSEAKWLAMQLRYGNQLEYTA